MSKQTFRLPSWRRKPTADEAAPDIADSELVPAESAARPTRHKHGKRTYVIGGALLALAIAAAIIIPGAVGGGDDDGAGGASTTLSRPDGDPSGQSAEDNIYITTGVMDQETYRSETTGETKAKVGFIDYNQAVHNVRVVTSDSVFTEAISTSMFVKLGEQKYFKDGAILVRKASSISGDTATWSDQIVAISQQDYQDAYGQDPRNLSNYVISRDTVQNPSMTANDDGTYTDEAWAAAEKKANDLLTEWKNGEHTEESFAFMAAENSADPGSAENGGLYEDVYPGQMVDAFDAWCFDASRQPGDTGIVKTEYGYHVMYFVGDDVPCWQVQVENTLRSRDTEAWQKGLTDSADVVELSGMKHVG